MAVPIPLDGRLTSQATLDLPLDGGEVMYIVSPGTAAAGNSYKVTTGVLGAFFAAFPVLNTTVITAGATNVDPYDVAITDTRILFNKTLASPSFAVMPFAASMAYPFSILIKDLKGDADVNPITITFSGGELCDGLSTVTIENAFGWVTLTPVPGGGAWFMS